VAALAPQVEAERAAGDKVALAILEDGVEELWAAASSVAERLGMQREPFRFVLSGGVFTGIPWLVDQMRRRLPMIASQSTVSRLGVEPALGAVHLALAVARGEAPVPRYLD
jgi:N-acetylglucosamine kinase-like BadF-type ATPase